MIEVVPGQEGIVSGMVTPDHHVVHRTTGQTVTEVISVKDVAFVYDAETGGTRAQPLPPNIAAAAVLSAADLARLRELGVRLEQFFGQPQDVEWSLVAGDLFLLQSRPITTL
jgi:pyruvate,water dikinase